MAADQIKLLTLNCWGLKFFSRNRNERIAALGIELPKTPYDIIALQELWVYSDYEFLRDSVSARLPFSKFFYSGALGAGLVIFSRFPIIDTFIHPYSLNGAPIDVLAGDWFVGKAAASVLVSHPELGHIQVFNTHLFAKGNEDAPEHMKAHRLVNAWEFSKLALQAAQLGRHVIAAGDFNCLPTSLPMTIIRDHAGLIDAWSATHQNATRPSSSGTALPPPLESIRKFGVTTDSPINSYSAGKALDSHASRYLGKRLDYIFYRQPFRSFLKRNTRVLKATETEVVFTEKVPRYDFSFSDHFGLECTFEIHHLNEESSLSLSGLETTVSQSSLTATIRTLTAGYRFSLSRARQELAIFASCVFLLLALIIGSAWQPYSWFNPIVTLVTVIIAWLATTMLYEGFIYGRWEQNALTGLIEELEIYVGRPQRRDDDDF